MDFAVNKLKLNQAKALCGANATEADVRAMYAKLGGLFYPEAIITKEEKKESIVETKVEAPKKEKKPAKKVTKKK